MPHILNALEQKYPAHKFEFTAIEDSASASASGSKFKFRIFGDNDANIELFKKQAQEDVNFFKSKIRKQEIELRKAGQLENRVLQLEAHIGRLSLAKTNPQDYPQDVYLAVLFLDVQGFSTSSQQEIEQTLRILWQTLPVIAEFDQAQCPNTWGDAVKVAFGSAKDAVEFAMKVKGLLAVWGLKVRIGIDIGVP